MDNNVGLINEVNQHWARWVPQRFCGEVASYTGAISIVPYLYFFRLYRLREMQTIVTDGSGVYQSVCLSATRLNSASLCKNG